MANTAVLELRERLARQRFLSLAREASEQGFDVKPLIFSSDPDVARVQTMEYFAHVTESVLKLAVAWEQSRSAPAKTKPATVPPTPKEETVMELAMKKAQKDTR